MRLKEAAGRFLVRFAGRRPLARLGRFLSMQARLDVPNDPQTNGEERLLEAYAAAWRARKERVTVFDVGANRGDWSEALARVLASMPEGHPAAEVHAFEPVPASREALERRLEVYRQVVDLRPVAAAVADAPGEQAFHVYGEAGRRSSLAPILDEAAREVLHVPTVTLDGYAQRLGIEHVAFAKVDTEGFDAAVLRGAERLFREGRIDALQFEYNQRWIETRSFLRDAFAFAESHGYRVGKVTPYGIERYEAWHFELESFREGNYLLYRHDLPPGLPSFPWWGAEP